jgi:hypothetical protein
MSDRGAIAPVRSAPLRGMLRRVADHAADWLERLPERPVRPDHTPAEFRMADALADALRSGDGRPTIVIAQVGNVNGGAADPMDAVCAAAHAAGAWVHVDGAFGLWAAASPSRRHLARGVEHADSWATDAHKWLNVHTTAGSHSYGTARRIGQRCRSRPIRGRRPLGRSHGHRATRPRSRSGRRNGRARLSGGFDRRGDLPRGPSPRASWPRRRWRPARLRVPRSRSGGRGSG